jgi:hypothetical protein
MIDTSGMSQLPPGFAGAATPLTEVIVTLGEAIGVGIDRLPVKDIPVTVPVNVLVPPLSSTRPNPPE